MCSDSWIFFFTPSTYITHSIMLFILFPFFFFETTQGLKTMHTDDVSDFKFNEKLQFYEIKTQTETNCKQKKKEIIATIFFSISFPVFDLSRRISPIFRTYGRCSVQNTNIIFQWTSWKITTFYFDFFFKSTTNKKCEKKMKKKLIISLQ